MWKRWTAVAGLSLLAVLMWSLREPVHRRVYLRFLQAASDGELPIVRAGVTCGLSLNHHPPGLGHPLHVAAASAQDAIVSYLLGHGADPNVRGKLGYTALEAASHGGHPTTVEILIRHGADPNARGEDGTPLNVAVKGCQPEVVRVLLDGGADPALTLRWSPSALSLAETACDPVRDLLVIPSP